MHHIGATVYNPTYTQQKQLYLGFERHHTHKWSDLYSNNILSFCTFI